MPRNVRNFWFEGHVDGRGTVVEGGPIAATGGFRLEIYQRHQGGVVRVGTLDGWATEMGKLKLAFTVANGASEEGATITASPASIIVETRR